MNMFCFFVLMISSIVLISMFSNWPTALGVFLMAWANNISMH
jgi:hypothetical protein